MSFDMQNAVYILFIGMAIFYGLASVTHLWFFWRILSSGNKDPKELKQLAKTLSLTMILTVICAAIAGGLHD